jgi:hypothetical protein
VGRRRGKARSRILYWFRTPPGVRVGRAALDEDAIRLIEEHNPDVEFDWTRILKGDKQERQEPQPRRDQREQKPRRDRSQQPSRHAPPQDRPVEPPPAAETEADLALASAEREVPEPAPLEPELFEPEPEPVEPLGLAEPAEAEEPDWERSDSAAHKRLGSEGLARLRARYAEVMARISERIDDPARQEELKSQAERLNPDTWVTDAEVTAGLEQYEATFEVLRSAVGAGPRRRGKHRQ